MTPRRVLFVCTGNICRSASAEVMARRRLAELGWSHVEVSSAGVSAEPGRSCPPETLASLKRRGVDARPHRARFLTPELVDWADLILAMTQSHQMAVVLRHPRSVGKVKLFKSYVGLSGDVEDPYGGDAGAHDACTEEITDAVEKLLNFLKEERR